jgi:hypothetical protein
MGFCGFGQLAAYVDLYLNTDALGVLREINSRSAKWPEQFAVEMHEAVVAFGDVDIVVSIKTNLDAVEGQRSPRGDHPTLRIANCVNELRQISGVSHTKTRILVHDPWHDRRMGGKEGGTVRL